MFTDQKCPPALFEQYEDLLSIVVGLVEYDM
jgi:hypothetical protein